MLPTANPFRTTCRQPNQSGDSWLVFRTRCRVDRSYPATVHNETSLRLPIPGEESDLPLSKSLLHEHRSCAKSPDLSISQTRRVVIIFCSQHSAVHGENENRPDRHGINCQPDSSIVAPEASSKQLPSLGQPPVIHLRRGGRTILAQPSTVVSAETVVTAGRDTGRTSIPVKCSSN